MLKNWKSLFVKATDEEPMQQGADTFSFPVANDNRNEQPVYKEPVSKPAPLPAADSAVQEVLEVYESGIDSINMPGYDFYEFYKAVTSTGHAGQHTYVMAFQMAKAFDKTITPQKLVSDAEFYISKINEVHGQYVTQGQQKLQSLRDKRAGEKNSLQRELDDGARRLAQLRTELQELERLLDQKKNALSRIEEAYQPQEKTIQEKLLANDAARNASIDKLSAIRQGIVQFIIQQP